MVSSWSGQKLRSKSIPNGLANVSDDIAYRGPPHTEVAGNIFLAHACSQISEGNRAGVIKFIIVKIPHSLKRLGHNPGIKEVNANFSYNLSGNTKYCTSIKQHIIVGTTKKKKKLMQSCYGHLFVIRQISSRWLGLWLVWFFWYL